MRVRLYFDGACDNNANPPIMGIGVYVVIDGNHAPEWDIAKCLGVGTNNIAEWGALIEALQVAIEMAKKYPDAYFLIFGDSQIIVKQFNKEWAINKPHLQECADTAEIYAEVLENRLKSVSWIRRQFNEDADKLSKKGLNADIKF